MTKPNRKPEDKEPGGGGVWGSAYLEDTERDLQDPPLMHPLSIHRVPHSDEETLIPNVTETFSPINCHIMVRRCRYSCTLPHNLLNCNIPFTPGSREASKQRRYATVHTSAAGHAAKIYNPSSTTVPPSLFPQHLKCLEFCYLIG